VLKKRINSHAAQTQIATPFRWKAQRGSGRSSVAAFWRATCGSVPPRVSRYFLPAQLAGCTLFA